jgi:hypothetical protein
MMAGPGTVAATLFLYLMLAPVVPRLMLSGAGIVAASLFLYLILA